MQNTHRHIPIVISVNFHNEGYCCRSSGFSLRKTGSSSSLFLYASLHRGELTRVLVPDVVFFNPGLSRLSEEFISMYSNVRPECLKPLHSLVFRIARTRYNREINRFSNMERPPVTRDARLKKERERKARTASNELKQEPPFASSQYLAEPVSSEPDTQVWTRDGRGSRSSINNALCLNRLGL